MPRLSPAESPNILIDDVTDWLMSEALGEPRIEHLVAGTAARMDAGGTPIQRFHISFNILHPLHSGMSLTWRRGEEVVVTSLGHTRDPTNPAWLKSPLNHMIQRRITSLRRKLVGPDAMLDFPVLEELRQRGATDYYAFLIPFGDSKQDGLIGSWVTDRKSGFFNIDLRTLDRVQRRLAVACRMTIRRQVAQNVVKTYLGRGAGECVLAGQIRRGDGETILAVIWYSDLRGSTAMAERLDREAYTEVLNCYFECVGGAILDAGGEILGFIGDAILAIFPIYDKALDRIHADARRPAGPFGLLALQALECAGPAPATHRSYSSQACSRAFSAAQDAQRRLDLTNTDRAKRGMPQLRYGLALHVGEVMFGNIGTPERLSFSVIGPSVNQVVRLEELTKKVGRPILASRAFTDSCPANWESLGKHKVQGIAEPIEVFAPKPADAPEIQRRPEDARSKSPMAKAQ